MKAVLRMQKIKSVGDYKRTTAHSSRRTKPENANPKGFHVALKEPPRPLESILPEKRRKDAVIAIEMVLSASPDYFKAGIDTIKWTSRTKSFLEKEFGENLHEVYFHDDEQTPHIHAFIIPKLKDGRLCAKEFTTRKTLIKWQDDYAAALEGTGIQRGLRGSKAKHTEVTKYYGVIAKALDNGISLEELDNMIEEKIEETQQAQAGRVP